MDLLKWSIPTQEEYKASRSLGEKYLLDHFGYAVGDTVYMDGKVPATIDRAMYDNTGLTVMIRVSGKAVADHFNIESYRTHKLMIFPCGEAAVRKMTKQPLSGEVS